MPDEIKKMDLRSMDVVIDKTEQLKALFPEVVTEGKVDFEKLKLALGEAVETGRERYGLNWAGKADCFKIIQQPSVGTLKPAREESVNFDETENLFIEGDNLEVLKLLQKSYYGKVKMIYIDPPYNTGNDFIYPDNYAESLDTYLKYTGQVDDEGRKYSTNTEADGRFHTKWINMMYPRLYLARNLLRDDGIIFITIDDTEVKNLRAICDEIFGEESFIANIVWQKKQSPQNDATYFSDMHDHILVYVKRAKSNKNDPEGWSRNLLERGEEQDSRYSNPDNDPRGDWASVDYTCNKTADERPNLFFPIKNPNTGKEIWPSRQRVWRYEKSSHKKNEEEKRIWWGSDGNSFPRLKRFKTEVQQGIVPSTWWDRSQVGDNQESRRELRKLFEDIEEDVFDTPKPLRLIKRMMQISTSTDNDDIVLDFFAGSASMAHALLEMNCDDKGNRKFICVQLPELIDENIGAYKAGFKNIADVGKERIRRAIQQIKKTTEGKLTFNEDMIDLGFKVLKLDKSNFKIWEAENVKDPESLQKQLELHIDHIASGSSQEDILYELLLKSGFELTTKIEKMEIAGKTVFSIAEGMLLICLEEELTKELIRAMADMKPSRVICLDKGFRNNDQLKTNAVQTMKSKGVEDFLTV